MRLQVKMKKFDYYFLIFACPVALVRICIRRADGKMEIFFWHRWMSSFVKLRVSLFSSIKLVTVLPCALHFQRLPRDPMDTGCFVFLLSFWKKAKPIFLRCFSPMMNKTFMEQVRSCGCGLVTKIINFFYIRVGIVCFFELFLKNFQDDFQNHYCCVTFFVAFSIRNSVFLETSWKYI